MSGLTKTQIKTIGDKFETGDFTREQLMGEFNISQYKFNKAIEIYKEWDNKDKPIVLSRSFISRDNLNHINRANQKITDDLRTHMKKIFVTNLPRVLEIIDSTQNLDIDHNCILIEEITREFSVHFGLTRDFLRRYVKIYKELFQNRPEFNLKHRVFRYEFEDILEDELFELNDPNYIYFEYGQLVDIEHENTPNEMIYYKSKPMQKVHKDNYLVENMRVEDNKRQRQQIFKDYCNELQKEKKLESIKE